MTAASSPTTRGGDPEAEQRRGQGQPGGHERAEVNSSTSAAIMMPTASEEIAPCCALAMIWPSSSTRRPSPLARCARSIIVLPVLSGTAPGSSSSGCARRRSCRRARSAAGSASRRCPRGPRDRATRRSMRAARPAAGAGRRLPDDVDRVGALLREALLEQLGRRARLRPGRRVVGRPVAGQRGRGERGDEAGDPGDEHGAAAAEGEVGEPPEPTGAGGGETRRTSGRRGFRPKWLTRKPYTD